jgi:hypothetical protein
MVESGSELVEGSRHSQLPGLITAQPPLSAIRVTQSAARNNNNERTVAFHAAIPDGLKLHLRFG